MFTASLLSACGGPGMRGDYQTDTRQPPPVVTPSKNIQTEEKQTAVEEIKEEILAESIPPAALNPPLSAENGMAAQEHHAVDAQFIDQRIALYEKKYQQWIELAYDRTKPAKEQSMLSQQDNCGTLFESLLSNYTKLKTSYDPQQNAAGLDKPDPFAIIRQDITLLESSCMKTAVEPTDSTTAPQQSQPGLSIAEESEAQINALIEQGKYREGITAYLELSEKSPDHQVSEKTMENYGRALLNSGHLEEAARLFTKILAAQPPPEQSMKPWLMHRIAADLLLISGNLPGAAEQYEQLIKALNRFDREKIWADDQLAAIKILALDQEAAKSFIELLENYLIFDGKRNSAEIIYLSERIMQSYPDSPLSRNALVIKTTVYDSMKTWVGDQMIIAEGMIEAKQIQEAITFLKDLIDDDLPIDLAAVVQETLDNLIKQDAQENESQKLLLAQSLTMQWESAVRSLDSGHYDEAIKGFQALFSTSYDEMAREKAGEAARTAANEKRKEAAIMFSKAVKLDRTDQKRDLLVQSRMLLLEIITKYPEVDIIDKVNLNLKTIENYIKGYDSSILDDQVDAMFKVPSDIDQEQKNTLQEERNGTPKPPPPAQPPTYPVR